MMAKKNVLFVTYGGGHATMIAPIMRALINEHTDTIQCTALALTMGGVFFKKQGLPYIGFADFITDEDSNARRYGELLLGNDHAAHTGISREESVAYLGLSYSDMIKRLGEHEAKRLYDEKGRMAFLPISVLQRVFDRIQPDLLVTTNSPRAEAASLHVAKERNVPTLVITDLMGTFSYPIEADHMTAANRIGLENYQQLSQIRVKNFHLAGNPAMDHLLAFRDLDIAAYKRAHFPEAAHARKIILLDQQQTYYLGNGNYGWWTDDDRLKVLNAVYAIAREQDACLFIRPHPSMDRSYFREWITRNNLMNTFEGWDYDIGPLLRAVDVVISGHSTIMLDAAYSHTPIIVGSNRDGGNLLGFDTLKFAYSATWEDHASLKSAITRALHENTTNIAHTKRFYEIFPELPCTARIASLISTLISQQS